MYYSSIAFSKHITLMWDWMGFKCFDVGLRPPHTFYWGELCYRPDLKFIHVAVLKKVFIQHVHVPHTPRFDILHFQL